MFTVPSLLRLAVYLGSWTSNPYPSLNGYDYILEADLRGNDYCSVVQEESTGVGDFYNGYVAYHFEGYFLTNDRMEYEGAHGTAFYLDTISYQIYPYNITDQVLVASQPRTIVVRKIYDDFFDRFDNRQFYLHTSFVDDSVAEVVTFDDGDETFVSAFNTQFGIDYGGNYTVVDSRIDESGLLAALTDKMRIAYLEHELAEGQVGYINGFNDGEAYGRSEDANIVAIFAGILDIGLLPVNFFLSIFNFDLMGINITSFISALITVFLIVVIIRSMISGGNSNA